MQKLNIDYQDIQIISSLYWAQTARIKLEGSLSEEISIQKDVRQGCILLPMRSTLYSEYIFCEALEDALAGIAINGFLVNNIRYMLSYQYQKNQNDGLFTKN